MSLLMEALRKAEEAKRRAAQGPEIEKPEPVPGTEELVKATVPAETVFPASTAVAEATESAAPAVNSDTSSSDDLIAALIAYDTPTTAILPVSAPESDVFDTSAVKSGVSQQSDSSALDIPLGFSLDAEPATDVPAVVSPVEPKPQELPFGDDIFASLKLTDAPVLAPEQEMTDFLLELAVHSTEPKKAEIQTIAHDTPLSFSEPAPVPDTKPTPEPALQPLHRDEPKPAIKLEPGVSDEPAPATQAKPERPVVRTTLRSEEQSTTELERTKASKFKDAVAAKKSVRALFASKNKSSLTPQRRLFVLGSIAAGATVLVIGGWFGLSMMSGPGNQYVIPPLSENQTFSEGEFAPVAAQSGEIDPNLTAAPVIELSAESTVESAADLAIEAVVEPTEELTIEPATQSSMEVAAETLVAAEPAVEPNAELTAEPAAETPAEPTAELAAVVPDVEQTVASPVTASPAATAAAAAAAPALPTDPDTGLVELPLDAGQSGSGSVTAGSQSAIRISRSEPMRNPDMQMLTAWSAYQQGDYAAARILYQQALARDPDNRDALLGVAASAMQQGDMVSARQTYNRLLTMNPRDPLARTGLLETTTASDPVRRETDLKALKDDHPNIAAVSYSLGNLYASQQRWHDAQQAYYDALLTARTQGEGPVSPDYAFNLAISLERINQPEAALNFYREALALSSQHVPSFDMNVLEQRLRALERNQP